MPVLFWSPQRAADSVSVGGGVADALAAAAPATAVALAAAVSVSDAASVAAAVARPLRGTVAATTSVEGRNHHCRSRRDEQPHSAGRGRDHGKREQRGGEVATPMSGEELEGRGEMPRDGC